jgi:hypothetical protein
VGCVSPIHLSGNQPRPSHAEEMDDMNSRIDSTLQMEEQEQEQERVTVLSIRPVCAPVVRRPPLQHRTYRTILSNES